jgi:hypothetical protein
MCWGRGVYRDVIWMGDVVQIETWYRWARGMDGNVVWTGHVILMGRRDLRIPGPEIAAPPQLLRRLNLDKSQVWPVPIDSTSGRAVPARDQGPDRRAPPAGMAGDKAGPSAKA